MDNHGEQREAESLGRRALMARRTQLGNQHPDTLLPWTIFATFVAELGKLDEAEPLYRESLSGRRECLGDEHPHTLNAIYNLADLLMDQGKLAEDSLFKEALAGFTEQLG